MTAPTLEPQPPPAEEVPLSQAFRRFVDNLGAADASLAEVVQALGERSLLVALIIFSLPNCIPAPPAVGSIFALPVVIVAWQILRGYHGLRLPGILARRRVQAKHLRWMANKGMKPLVAVERRCRHRLAGLTTPRAERILAAWVLLLALVVLFPGPMTNFLPAIGIVIVSVGLLERDGGVVLGGILFGIVAVIVAVSATVVLFGGLWLGIEALFG
jgi:hypothetical protein